ncbi:MAG: hypothetical protein J6S26_01430 [Solobacterium sp.]|nr:hypothetical protein [Solobacterium sp.]
MKLIRGLFKLLFTLITALLVFLLACVLTFFLWNWLSGGQGMSISSFRDITILLKTIGENTNIPIISPMLSSIEVADSEYHSPYVFDERFFPYYGMLDEDEKIIYAQMYECVMNGENSFAPAAGSLNADKIEEIWMAVYDDHPELFWLDETCSFTYLSGGQVTEVHLDFNALGNHLEENITTFENAALGILQGCEAYSSANSRELCIHDSLAQSVEYDTNASYHQTAWSALVDGRSVCAGYARAYQYLMTKSGIPCYYATGWSGENHGWNIVELDGEYYNVDVTWDDTADTHAFFNRTDADLSATHYREDHSLDLPACTGETYHNRETIPEIRFGFD